MAIITYKPLTPSLRHKNYIKFEFLSKERPEKKLVYSLKKNSCGRNNMGRITSRRRGGGHKKRYRIIAFKKPYVISTLWGYIEAIEYDPYRNALLAKIVYLNGLTYYHLCLNTFQVGDIIPAEEDDDIFSIGTRRRLCEFPNGAEVCNVERTPGRGGQLARAAGAYAKIVTKRSKDILVTLMSEQVYRLHNDCLATAGRIGNSEYRQRILGKAGIARWFNRRPKVRGSAMNAIDHPHGGGEGKCPIGKTQPRTPWGKYTLGAKTGKIKKIKRKKKAFAVI